MVHVETNDGDGNGNEQRQRQRQTTTANAAVTGQWLHAGVAMTNLTKACQEACNDNDISDQDVPGGTQ